MKKIILLLSVDFLVWEALLSPFLLRDLYSRWPNMSSHFEILFWSFLKVSQH